MDPITAFVWGFIILAAGLLIGSLLLGIIKEVKK